MNDVDKRFGQRDHLVRFRDAQVRSSKAAKNRYVRQISFERPPYGVGGMDGQKPLMLLVPKGIAASSALLSAAESEFSGKLSVCWRRANTLNVYLWGPRGSSAGGHGPM